MRYTYLGRTGLQVSKLCLGTMNFGTRTQEKDSFAVMDKALDGGINFFDTANVYGGVVGEGITESIVGRWIAQGSRREKIVLATKVYGQMGDGINDKRLSAYHIRKACEDSLQRLQTDHIDLYQMHHVDRNAPWDEIWQAMELLVQQGKILYVGSSNFAGWDIATACQAASGRNFLGLVCEQSKYSLSSRHIEHEVIPACQHYGLGLIPWSPLDGGMLGGILNGAHEGRRSSEKMKQRVEANREKIEHWEALCKEMGAEPGTAALAWLNAQPAVTAPIIGPRTAAQLDGALAAVELELSQNTLEKIDAVFPPKGIAPNYYSW
ncbi:MAG: aldo/keto reductase [Chitinivibrionales bacterium]|nr:aldo/keto reductase [Chitinivibrionales bacterium]